MIKKLLFLIGFLLVAENCFAENLNYNTDVFDLGRGKKNYKCHTAHINYKDPQGNFQDIDHTLTQDTNKKWKLTKASYHPTIPEYADEWFEFYNAYEGANHTIKVKPVCKHVQGVYFKGEDGNGVIYKDVFGVGIDLKVYAYWAGLKKVIIINEKPADTSKDLIFDFELELPAGKERVKDKEGNVWNKTSKLDFKDKTLKIGDDGKESYFRNARVWDSSQDPRGINQPIDIELYKQGNKIFLRKTIKAEILQKAIYPLFTDHPTTYTVGVGNGRIDETYIGSSPPTQAQWSTIRAVTTGDNVTTSATVVLQGEFYNPSTEFYLSRSFFPVDTSGIDDDATITDATFYIYAPGTVDTTESTNPANGALVGSTQVDPTSLATSDFGNLGTTRFCDTDVTVVSFGSAGWKSWVLNATGIAAISKTSYTKLGMRAANDFADSTYPSQRSYAFGHFVADANDPYLDVTVSAGAARRIIFTQ